MNQAVLDNYIVALRLARTNRHTLTAKRTAIRGMLKAVDKPAAEISKMDLSLYLLDRAEAGVKDSTLRTHVVNLRTFFDWMIGEGLRVDNPARTIALPKQHRPQPKYITIEDARRILAVTLGPEPAGPRRVRDHAVLAAFLFLGLRLAELCDLKLADVDMVGGVLTVQKGKGGKMRRIPMNQNARAAIQRWLMVRPAVDNDGLFLGIFGEPLSQRVAYETVRRAGRVTGIKLHPHQLRHTFAMLCVEASVNLVTVMDLLGHTTLAATSVYQRATPAAMAKAVEAISF